ncbi:DUF2255 family protein [Fulvivirgaceae bacterium PWU4]|uniref:DUF2255 family protein n=1 Tax=Chryseosolibacter histidini TaxID=2782349 RepID=A0AAP2DR55_9BACT|nr:DUF2255 family protein [Chryseosolibacter histidini]MBT1699492.1 DUF2255 family protein [Chryseosolibacter histidini]
MTNQSTSLKSLLEKVALADDLHISPFREDGITYGTPTWIWSVVVNNELYVRPYHGQKSKWYQAALSQRAGRITVAGKAFEVSFAPVSGEVNKAVDNAYRKKYVGSPYLNSMVSEKARSATVRIDTR